jgi:DNA-binding response OmpR family regulator
VSELPLILVIEDEYLVQSEIEAALTDGGFAVELVFSGEEALTLFGTKDFKALVTDVRLGQGPSGWEVAKRIREKEPSFPVVYLTAASADDWASNGVPNSVLITKPFAPAQLVTGVSNLLNIGTPPAA